MGYVVGILSIISLGLVIYIISIQNQMKSISHQLEKRLKEHTRQGVSLELVSKDLSRLAMNLNRCLKEEENMRLKGLREEKKFKEMIANISHDLRTPLTAIQGYQQLLEKSELSKEQREKLEIAIKHGIELKNLIDHFFEYAYLLNSGPVPQFERINLTNVVTECLVAHITELEEKQITLEFQEPPPIFIMADKEMITRIIQNLMRNGIQHAAGLMKVELEGGKEVTLRFRNPIKNGEVVDCDKIFERFYTADPSRRKSTGLGLSIVKLLVEQLNGQVCARKEGTDLVIEITLTKFE